MKKKNILFIGAPGSGKGTYSRIISPVLLVCYSLCMSPIVAYIWIRRLYEEGDCKQVVLWRNREAIYSVGWVGSWYIVLPVIQSILSQPTYKSGVILDGFPRTIVQADAIAKSIPIDLVLYFHLPREVLIQKLTGRRWCCSDCIIVECVLNAVVLTTLRASWMESSIFHPCFQNTEISATTATRSWFSEATTFAR